MNNPQNQKDPSGKSIWGWLGAIAATAVGITVGVLLAPVIGVGLAVMAGLATAAIIDPAFTAGLALAAIDLTVGNALKFATLQWGKMATPSFAGGGMFMKNSIFPGMGEDRPFALGPFAFLPPGRSVEDSWHETGHFSQWSDWSGWGYTITALEDNSGIGEPGWFEWDADRRAGTCEYYNPNNPACFK